MFAASFSSAVIMVNWDATFFFLLPSEELTRLATHMSVTMKAHTAATIRTYHRIIITEDSPLCEGVGVCVGTCDGECAGVVVGVCVDVGVYVEVFVGVDVGAYVGLLVGAFVGVALGADVGVFVGVPVRADV